MSEIRVDTISEKTSTSGVTIDSVTIKDGKVVTQDSPYRNLIINGDMQVAQRSTSATGKTASGVYAVDRMALGMETLGTWTVAQETLTSGNAYDAGFKKAFRIDCTTADASPGSGDNLFFQYKIEGQNMNELKKGTSAAEKLTLQFWVKSNKTGTGQVVLFDDNSRAVGKTYAISSADTWEQKILTFPADTSGAIDNDNTKGFEIEWALDAGSTFQGGTLPATWTTSNNNFRSLNDFALGDNTNNDWAITGIQLEIGDAATDFEHLPYDVQEQKCQRYCMVYGNGQNFNGGYYNATSYVCTVYFPTKMRAAPSVTCTDLTNSIRVYTNGGVDYLDTLGDNGDTVYISELYNNGDASATSGHAGSANINNGSFKLTYDSEL